MTRDGPTRVPRLVATASRVAAQALARAGRRRLPTRLLALERLRDDLCSSKGPAATRGRAQESFRRRVARSIEFPRCAEATSQIRRSIST
jgi:hypothetical protein